MIDASKPDQSVLSVNQGQDKADGGALLSRQTVKSSAVTPKQPATVRPSFTSSGFQMPKTPASFKPAVTPLALASSKSPFKATATSSLSSLAGQSAHKSPLTVALPKVMQKPPLPISKPTAQAGTSRTLSAFPVQQRSGQQSASASKLGSLPLSKNSGGTPPAPALPKPTFFSAAKPASQSTVNFGNPFKQPVRASSGGPQLPGILTPASGLTSLNSAPRPPSPATTGKLAGLPDTQAAKLKTKVAQSAVTPSYGQTTLESWEPAVNHELASCLPGQGIPVSSGQHLAQGPSLSQQQGKPAEQALQSKVPTVSAMPGQAASGALPVNSHADTKIEEAVQEMLVDSTPWISTSLAGGLMGNIKHLEAVSQQFRLCTRAAAVLHFHPVEQYVLAYLLQQCSICHLCHFALPAHNAFST